MKKRLTQAQFQRCIKDLDVGKQTIDIAHGVLVQGHPQTYFVSLLKLSKGAISQAVNRVWDAYTETDLPQGYERVSVILPKHQAHIVKMWVKNSKQPDIKK